MKKYTCCILLALLIYIGTFLPVLGHTDTLTLLNGRILKGNIIAVSSENNTVTLDVVVDGKLVGGRLQLLASEIANVKLSDEYQNLTKKELTKEEYRQNLEAVNKRFEFVRVLAENRYNYQVRTSDRLRRETRADQLRHENYDFEMHKIAYGLKKVLPRRRKADVNVNLGVDSVIALNEEYEDDGWDE